MDTEIPTIDEDSSQQIIVDPSSLQPETLRQLAKEFVIREVANDASFPNTSDATIDRIVASLKKGTYLITFDQSTETVGVAKAN